MYAEIERIIKEILNLDDEQTFISYSDEDGELQINEAVPFLLIRDLLMEYCNKETSREFVARTLVANCNVNALDAIDLIGAVDDLREKTKRNVQ